MSISHNENKKFFAKTSNFPCGPQHGELEGGDGMKAIIVCGDAKEIAALVVALQERQRPEFEPCDASCDHGNSCINQKCSC